MNNTTIMPAVTMVRGFHTPVMSGDEDSDHSMPSTPKFTSSSMRLCDIASPSSSPMMRSVSNVSVGGISKLKLQLETLSLENGNASLSFVRPGSQLRSQTQCSTGITTPEGSNDEESPPRMSYEIPLEHDFISREACDAGRSTYGDTEGELIQDTNVVRKMTASDFEPLRCLGKGAFGTVLLVKQQSTGRLYAQKQFRKASLTVQKELVEQTKTERAILESVNSHPFVVKLYYAFQDHEKLYLILEYAQGGELFTHLAQERMFPEDTASFYMAEMVLALDHLHSNLGVVYRDLKPENCLLDAEGHLLLTDFGLSKVAVDKDDHCKSILGTVEYMAPEVVQGQKYGFPVDWWSLGALGFDLLTGSPPFQANNHAKTLEKIVKSKLAMPYFLGPDAKDLLRRLLRKEPNKRLGTNMPKDLNTIKKHRFFRKIDWVALEKRSLSPPIRPLITDPELAENFAPEFTELSLSPVQTSKDQWSAVSGSAMSENPFGGFSYVASPSLLQGDAFKAF